MFGGMLINIIFISFALLFITKQIFEKQIDTIQEIVDNRFEVMGDGFALQHLNRQNQVNV